MLCVCKKDQPENMTMKGLRAWSSGQDKRLTLNYQSGIVGTHSSTGWGFWLRLLMSFSMLAGCLLQLVVAHRLCPREELQSRISGCVL